MQTPQHGLILSERRDPGYAGSPEGFYHLSASVVTVGPTAYDLRMQAQFPDEPLPPATEIRNASDDPIKGLYLKDFNVWSQGENGERQKGLYGWEVRYKDIYSVGYREVAAMAKTLATVQRRLARQAERYGCPESFGAYLGHVARAIGASRIVRPSAVPKGWAYSENDYVFLPIADGVAHANYLIWKWQQEGQPVDSATG